MNEIGVTQEEIDEYLKEQARLKRLEDLRKKINDGLRNLDKTFQSIFSRSFVYYENSPLEIDEKGVLRKHGYIINCPFTHRVITVQDILNPSDLLTHWKSEKRTQEEELARLEKEKRARKLKNKEIDKKVKAFKEKLLKEEESKNESLSAQPQRSRVSGY